MPADATRCRERSCDICGRCDARGLAPRFGRPLWPGADSRTGCNQDNSTHAKRRAEKEAPSGSPPACVRSRRNISGRRLRTKSMRSSKLRSDSVVGTSSRSCEATGSNWRERSPADLGIMLVEALAYVATAVTLVGLT